jgi:hypothetical protein
VHRAPVLQSQRDARGAHCRCCATSCSTMHCSVVALSTGGRTGSLFHPRVPGHFSYGPWLSQLSSRLHITLYLAGEEAEAQAAASLVNNVFGSDWADVASELGYVQAEPESAAAAAAVGSSAGAGTGRRGPHERGTAVSSTCCLSMGA